jgi:hypothetical protein
MISCAHPYFFLKSTPSDSYYSSLIRMYLSLNMSRYIYISEEYYRSEVVSISLSESIFRPFVYYSQFWQCTLQFQSLGEDVSSVYVEEYGREVSKEEIYHDTVVDMMMCAIEVDWRDFFPYLSWVPNKSFETRVLTAESKRTAMVRALVNQQKKRIEHGEVVRLHIFCNFFIFISYCVCLLFILTQ